ncbi:dabb-domain-containing protein [Xylariaceae sp. FL0804]|nr:dabb-domain-containing protein [Xylariaceae sp. FL0804]
MAIYHIVMFAFKSLVPADEVQAVSRPRTGLRSASACDRMVALGEKCIHPTSQKPYVKTIGGGRDNSWEGLQGGITHVFVSVFENEQDREYYTGKDPVHLEFVASIKDIVEKIQVVDFTPDAY